MGNLLVKIKRFISNKNTVTILCVLAGILVIYVGYNWRVSVATSPQSVPYANKTLVSGTVITQDDISYVEISKSVLDKTKNIITNANLIVGQAVAYGDTIQANSFFFEGDVKDPADNSYYPLASMEDDQEAQTLEVDIHTTFGNAIYPGNYIDLWFKDVNEEDKLIYGELIESIKVLDVTDEDGRSVFETGAESREPRSITFAVDRDLRLLIYAAREIGELVPVPRNKSYSENPSETRISSTYLQNYILSQVSVVPYEDTPSNGTGTEGNNE